MKRNLTRTWNHCWNYHDFKDDPMHKKYWLVYPDADRYIISYIITYWLHKSSLIEGHKELIKMFNDEIK